jgi:hypothetical protein
MLAAGHPTSTSLDEHHHRKEHPLSNIIPIHPKVDGSCQILLCPEKSLHVQWFLYEPCVELELLEEVGAKWIEHVHRCRKHGHFHLCDEHYAQHAAARDADEAMNLGIDHETCILVEPDRLKGLVPDAGA